MIYTKKTTLSLLGAMCGVASFALPGFVAAQDAPVAITNGSEIGFHLPMSGGNVTYAVSASQTFIVGYNGNAGGGNVTSTNVSGDVAFVTASEKRPFSLVYAGGFLGSESAQQPSSAFQNLSLSQVFRARKDTFIVADTVSYLPQSPTVGLSGIAGLGDLGVAPVQVGSYAGPGILTQYESRVSNVVSASDSHVLTGKTSLQGTVSYAIQRFLGNNNQSAINNSFAGLDTNQFGAGGGLQHRINARSSVGANYNFQNFSFTDNPTSFRSNSITGEYTYRFTPRLIFDGQGGPQFSSSSTFASTYVNASVAASLTYLASRGSLQLAYSRGTNTGSGVVAGALQDTVGFTGSRRFTRSFSGSASVLYSHSSSLPSLLLTPFAYNTEIASVQANRALGRYLSAYASYTIENQSAPTAGLSPLVFDGRSQIVGFGITYSPDSRRFGR